MPEHDAMDGSVGQVVKIEAGSRVVFLNTEAHAQCPRWYPPAGTVGRVLRVGVDTAWVQWPAGSTAEHGRWYAPLCELKPAPSLGFMEKAQAALLVLLERLKGGAYHAEK